MTPCAEHEATLALALERVKRLEEALRGLGKERQFRGKLCWCDTMARIYCVGQPQCNAANAALYAEGT